MCIRDRSQTDSTSGMDVTGSSPGSLRRQVDSPSFTGGGAAVRADDLPRWSAPAPSAALAWGRVGDRLPPRCRPLGSLLALARGGTDPHVDPSADGPASAPSNCYPPVSVRRKPPRHG